MGTWVRDSGERTSLGIREWSTKNELTEEREQVPGVGAVKGGHPPRPRSAVGPRQALSSASCRAFQAAKRVSGCNSTEHAVAAPVSSSLAAAPSARYRCAARGGQVCHRPASRPGCPDPHASRFLPAVARHLQRATGRVALAASSPGRRATLLSNGFQRVESGGRRPGARSRGWGGASALCSAKRG